METYTFDAELYLWEGQPGSWVFLNLPEEVADDIDDGLVGPPRGFGAVRVEVRVGATTWATSIFPSKQEATYVLPVKKAVRKAEGIEPGDSARVELTVLG